MASDEVVWQLIGKSFCSFKVKTPSGQDFCSQEHNVTGFCSRQACPLANSRYATVRQHPTKQTLYLLTKTIERAHLPSKLWIKTKLSNNYHKALEQIDRELIYWPQFLLHKCKQRLTRLRQVQMRARRVAAEADRLGERLVTKLAPKVRTREAARERKAEAAAKLERTIERELLERLRSGAYGEQPLNVSEAVWQKVLGAMERVGEASRDKDEDKGAEAEEEEEAEEEVVYVSDDQDESEEEELEDIQEWLESDEEAEDEDEDEDEEDDEEGEEEEATAASKKRKRGQATKMNMERLKQRRLEQERRPKMVEELTW